MNAYPEDAIRQVCRNLGVDAGFLQQCLEESVVEIQETQGRWELANGTTLRLRRLERICLTFHLDVPIALHLLELTRRIADLEAEVTSLRAPGRSSHAPLQHSAKPPSKRRKPKD